MAVFVKENKLGRRVKKSSLSRTVGALSASNSPSTLSTQALRATRFARGLDDFYEPESCIQALDYKA